MPWKNKDREREYKKLYHQKMKDVESYRETRKSHCAKWRRKNKLAVLSIEKRNREKNRDKRIEWYNKNKIILQGKCNLKTEALTESYMTKHLKKLGYYYDHIKNYPELLQTHRIIIKTKRLWKRSQTLLS